MARRPRRRPTPATAVARRDADSAGSARSYWAFRKPVRAAAPGGRPALSNPIDRLPGEDPPREGAEGRAARRPHHAAAPRLPGPDRAAADARRDRRVSRRQQRRDAWEQLIDRLLASPHYGERWGRHWLDVARYADSSGFEHDFDRPNAWRYRDYVIRAFNQDKPYDVFLAEQIAGDELDQVTDDSMIATGFLRSYAKVDYREKDNPQFRYEYLDDMIGTIGRGVLGLTVQVRALPQPQVRSDLAEGLLPDAGVAVRLCGDGSSAGAARSEAEAYEKKTAEIDAQIAPLAAADPAARGAVSRSAGAGEVQEVSRRTCSAPSRFRKTSERRARRCWRGR